MEVLYVVLMFLLICGVIILILKEEKKFKEEDEVRKKELNKIEKTIEEYKKEFGEYKEKPQLKIGDWEKEIRKDMKSIVDVSNKYDSNMNLNILVGDYNKESVSNTTSVLESMGLNVTIAQSGVEILERINNNEHYDLIISNNIYDRGHCDGPQTLFKLRNIEKFNTPVIVLTVSDNQREKFVDYYGFDEYMTKLLTQEKVIETLPKVINNLEFKKSSKA
jgi:CheY-like chemotaxis protein